MPYIHRTHEPLPPLAEGYEVAIAVDIGTSGIGVALIFPKDSTINNAATALTQLIYLKPDELGSPGTTEKMRNAVLVNVDKGFSDMTVGDAAIHSFLEQADEETPLRLELYVKFKPDLVTGCKARREAMNIMDVRSQAVGVLGAVSGSAPVLMLMSAVLEYVKKQVDAWMKTRGTLTLPKTSPLWMITVPAIWDDQAKSLMRQAAVNANLITDVSSQHLVLALEPECAILAAAADTSRILSPGNVVMVVDCGAGTIDITVERVETAHPLSLKEVTSSSGGSWGSAMVDDEFMNFMRKLMSSYWTYMSHTMILNLRELWEIEKLSLKASSTHVSIVISDLLLLLPEQTRSLGTYQFGEEVFRELIAVANRMYGRSGSNMIKLTKSKRLEIPIDIVTSFFKPSLDAVSAHVRWLLDGLDEIGTPVDVIVLAGGYCESPILQGRMRADFETAKRSIILPMRPGPAVRAGALLYALQTQPIASRRLRYSYGFVQAEEFDKSKHDAALSYDSAPPSASRMGVPPVKERRMVNVIVPIVQKGTDVSPGGMYENHELVPVRDDQNVIDLEIYRLDEHIPDPATSPSRRCVVVDGVTAAAGGYEHSILVPKSNRIAVLSVVVGSARTARESDRRVSLSIHFHATEITATAKSASGDMQSVVIKYDV